MQRSSRDLSDHLYAHQVFKQSAKRARQARVFSELCKRIVDEEVYYTEPYFKAPCRKDRFGRYSRSIYRYNYDIEYLGKMIRHIPGWWD